MIPNMIPVEWEKRAYCGYETDKWKTFREMAASRYGGDLVDAYMPEGYCILSDGEDIVAVRLVDREEIFRTKDPLPKLDAWQEVYKFMLEKGVIDGFDYFSRCDSDLALRIPAYRAAREAAESDLETLQKKFI
jgi:hypothetical protein